MSNLSNIGFPLKDKDSFEKLVERAYKKASLVKTEQGEYYCYHDPSNAELWVQIKDEQFIGMNPHFHGKSKRLVRITQSYSREESVLDGAYYSWAEPEGPVDYPFVFDVPNFYENEVTAFPANKYIQLTGFTHQMDLFDNEEEYYDDQESGIKMGAQSFIPAGLFGSDENDSQGNSAAGIFTGTILELELLKNQMTGENFYWFLVDTLGGQVDVVSDPRLIDREPKIGGILSGEFWLSGKLLT